MVKICKMFDTGFRKTLKTNFFKYNKRRKTKEYSSPTVIMKWMKTNEDFNVFLRQGQLHILKHIIPSNWKGEKIMQRI